MKRVKWISKQENDPTRCFVPRAELRLQSEPILFELSHRTIHFNIHLSIWYFFALSKGVFICDSYATMWWPIIGIKFYSILFYSILFIHGILSYAGIYHKLPGTSFCIRIITKFREYLYLAL